MDKREMKKRAQQSARDKKMARRPSGGKGTTMSVGTRKIPAATYKERRTVFESSPSGKNGRIRVVGQDYLGQFNTSSNLGAGSLIFNYPIAPTSAVFQGTRLGTFALLYEKYVYRRMKFHIQTGTPTQTQGSYVLAFDRDISDPIPPSTEAGVRLVLANQFARTAAVWEDCSIDVPLVDTQDFYYTNYTGSDARLAYQGRVISVVQTPLAGNTSLSMWCEYEIEFMDPALETSDVQSALSYNNSTGSTLGQGPNNLIPILNNNGSGIKGDVLNLAINGAGLLSGSNVTGGNQGFVIPSGTYEAELAVGIKNPSSSAATFSAYLPISTNVANPSGTAQYEALSALAPVFNSMFGTSSTVAATGEPGYNATCPSSGFDAALFKWLLNVPSGGAVVTPSIYSTIGNLLLQEAVFRIAKVSQKAGSVV